MAKRETQHNKERPDASNQVLASVTPVNPQEVLYYGVDMGENKTSSAKHSKDKVLSQPPWTAAAGNGPK